MTACNIPLSGYHKVYIKDKRLPCEEDLQHEFKGHRNFAVEEIPREAIANKTRRAISRNFCGFLNTGIGGTIYCGVLDSGAVIGIHLTDFQKDHVLLAVQDTFSRFTPSVTPDMFSVEFVPVLSHPDEEIGISPQTGDLDQRNQPHALRTSRYCWCDEDAAAQFNLGMIAQPYVIEIKVFPWDTKNKLSMTMNTPIQPLFCTEEGLYFIRRLGGLHQPTVAEVIQLAEAETIRYHASQKMKTPSRSVSKA